MARQMLVDSYNGRHRNRQRAPLAWVVLHQEYQVDIFAAEVDAARGVDTDDEVALLTAIIEFQRRQFDALQRYEAQKLLGILTILTQVLTAFALACDRIELDVLLALPLPEEVGGKALDL